MQNTTKQCPEIIGADTHGLADNTIGNQSLRIVSIDIGGRCSFQLTATIDIIGNQSLRMVSIDIGGRCRIRTHVSGSEGRKDIQTTLIARKLPD